MTTISQKYFLHTFFLNEIYHALIQIIISLTSCKTAVLHWSYCSLARSHWYLIIIVLINCFTGFYSGYIQVYINSVTWYANAEQTNGTPPSWVVSHVNRHKTWTGHDEVMTWKRFLYYWPFVRGIDRLSFGHDFTIKLLKYGTSCVRSTAHSVGHRCHSFQKGPVMLNCEVSLDVNPNNILNKQSGCQWFEMPWHSC